MNSTTAMFDEMAALRARIVELEAENARLMQQDSVAYGDHLGTRFQSVYCIPPTGAPDWMKKMQPLYLHPAPIPEGWKLLKTTTIQERSWPQDASDENGNYSNTCCECGRVFVGHKRRIVCRSCAVVPKPREEEL